MYRVSRNPSTRRELGRSLFARLLIAAVRSGCESLWALDLRTLAGALNP